MLIYRPVERKVGTFSSLCSRFHKRHLSGYCVAACVCGGQGQFYDSTSHYSNFLAIPCCKSNQSLNVFPFLHVIALYWG